MLPMKYWEIIADKLSDCRQITPANQIAYSWATSAKLSRQS